jgi:hypothetical protein
MKGVGPIEYHCVQFVASNYRYTGKFPITEFSCQSLVNRPHIADMELGHRVTGSQNVTRFHVCHKVMISKFMVWGLPVHAHYFGL